MGYKKGVFPSKYLGIDLENVRNSCKVWQNVLDKVDSRLGGWKDRWLSKVGKSIKIKSILSAIPSYPLSYLPLPK